MIESRSSRVSKSGFCMTVSGSKSSCGVKHGGAIGAWWIDDISYQ
jgi:hypothetical protein